MPSEVTFLAYIVGQVLEANRHIDLRTAQIERKLNDMDSRLTDILASGNKESADLDTIKTSLETLKQKEADLEVKLAATDPADGAAIDTIKANMADNGAKIAAILADFAPAPDQAPAA